jgi:mannose-1-phosphate guanylyltransferase/mannose-6-phosphate isomerase
MEKITTKEFIQLTDHRPWGSFTILADEPDHKVKRIVVKAGQRLSLQRHKRRQEHWLVVSGQALVTRNDELLELGPGQAVDIGLGDIHRVQNASDSDMVFIEIQLGDYFGEDDIERLDDDYGRQGTR